MENKLKLQPVNLPKALGSLIHSNQFLKNAVFFSYFLSILLVVTLIWQTRKSPEMFAFDLNAVPVELVPPPSPESEVIEAVKFYIDHRYKWEPKTVVQSLQSAESFILPQSRKAYEVAVANVSKFSIEKSVSQRAYVTGVTVDLDKQVALVSGDRITNVQGLRAAGDLKIELNFDNGPHSKGNPWGIYITKEKDL
jgi:hypothetical protein